MWFHFEIHLAILKYNLRCPRFKCSSFYLIFVFAQITIARQLISIEVRTTRLSDILQDFSQLLRYQEMEQYLVLRAPAKAFKEKMSHRVWN